MLSDQISPLEKKKRPKRCFLIEFKTKGAVTLRFLNVNGAQKKSIRRQKKVFTRKPIIDKKRLDIDLHGKKSVAAENYEFENQQLIDIKKTFPHFWPIEN